jgi:hypothetical protein
MAKKTQKISRNNEYKIGKKTCRKLEKKKFLNDKNAKKKCKIF